MSSYEDIGLSYVSFGSASDYAHLTLAAPIATNETFYLAFKASNVVGTGGFISMSGTVDGTLLQMDVTGGSLRLRAVDVGGIKANTGLATTWADDHIIVIKITPGAPHRFYVDTLAQLYTDNENMTFAAAVSRIAINAVTNFNGTFTAANGGRFYWLALYSSLSNDDITDLMAGASPLTVGTLRSGDSFWAFDGSFAGYNGGTSFTPVGSPSFVQPAYPDTLSVIDSYLRFTTTQYAQVTLASPITAPPDIRIAIKFRALGGTGDPYLLTLGSVLTGADGFALQFIDSTGALMLYRYRNGSVDGSATVADFGSSFVDGQDHTVIVQINGTAVTAYIDDGATAAATFTGSGAFTVSMSTLTLNAKWDGTTATQKGSNRIYWVGLFNTLSPADRVALMQGEHPASVGNTRNLYTLEGSPAEYNAGTALTLYNDPDFIVPQRGLSYSLANSLSFSLSNSLEVRA